MPNTEDFQKAVESAKSITKKPSNEDLLQMYALYKQATEGDIKGDKPSMFDFKASAKYQVWEKQKGKTNETAMEEYIVLVDKLLKA